MVVGEGGGTIIVIAVVSLISVVVAEGGSHGCGAQSTRQRWTD